MNTINKNSQKYKIGLLYGRFQPFHNGHLYLIKKALESVDKLIIGIGSANVYDDSNPFTYEQRKRIVETVIKHENIGDKIENIVGLDDFYDDNLWFKNCLKTIVSELNVVVGNNEWTNKIFEKRNIPILRIKYYRRELYEGMKIRKLMKKEQDWRIRTPKYIVPLLDSFIVKNNKMKFKYYHVALGGTFDHFHKGHSKLIDTAFKLGQNVSIGIADDKMSEGKLLSQTIEKLGVRSKELGDYLKRKNYISRTKQYVLHDIFGPTITDGTIEAIVVSKQTFSNVSKINAERLKRNLPKMDIILVKDVKGRDKKIVSSERIRTGEIDRQGTNFLPIKSGFNFQKKTLKLPENLREKLRNPLGKVITTTKKVVQSIELLKPTMIIAVGDIIYTSLIKTGLIPDLGIIDYRSRRRPILNFKFEIFNEIFKSNFQFSKKIINESGTINLKAVEAIKNTIENFLRLHHPQGVIINGEEDLLALPAVLLAPLGSVVLYGQYGLGVVAVLVTEAMKKKVKSILNKFIG